MATMTITLEELRHVVDTKLGGALRAGGHTPGDKACVWEAYNLARGKEWGDRKPDCVASDLHALLIQLNDSQRWADDKERADVLLPACIRALGSEEGGVKAMRARAYRFADLAVRVIAPRALDSRGLSKRATTLRNLPAIVDRGTALAGRRAADAAHADAAAAHADDAAHAAARHAAWIECVHELLRVAGLED